MLTIWGKRTIALLVILLLVFVAAYCSRILSSIRTGGRGPHALAASFAATKNSLGMRMVKLPGGQFIMGNDTIPDAYPAHPVQLSPFYISDSEVTNVQFEQFKRRM